MPDNLRSRICTARAIDLAPVTSLEACEILRGAHRFTEMLSIGVLLSY
jgi:hypothetical protein